MSISNKEVHPIVRSMDERAIRRRIAFLLDEARSPNPVRDQTVTYAMRVISNFYSIGRDASSSRVKKECRRMSRRVLKLRNRGGDDWLKQTVNEHQEPLEQVWNWIRSRRKTLSFVDVAKQFRQWPMVTVTCDEDKLLRNLRHMKPKQRYRKAGIKIVCMHDDGTWR